MKDWDKKWVNYLSFMVLEFFMKYKFIFIGKIK